MIARVSGFSYTGSLHSAYQEEGKLKSARAVGGTTGELGLRSQLFCGGHSAGPLLQWKAPSLSSVALSKPTLCHRAGHSLYLKIFHSSNILEKIAWNKGYQCLCLQDMQKWERAIDNFISQIRTPGLYLVLCFGGFSHKNSTLSAILINLEEPRASICLLCFTRNLLSATNTRPSCRMRLNYSIDFDHDSQGLGPSQPSKSR